MHPLISSSALKSCRDKSSRREQRRKKSLARMSKWIIESLGAIAQQGGIRSLDALVELVGNHDPEIQALAVSELSVAYWHRPNDISDSILQKIYDLTTDREAIVAESALAALQNLADVGCLRAESFFSVEEEED
jgi:hypothetical protein